MYQADSLLTYEGTQMQVCSPSSRPYYRRVVLLLSSSLRLSFGSTSSFITHHTHSLPHTHIVHARSQGMVPIMTFLTEKLTFKTVQHILTSTDSQPLPDGGILCTVRVYVFGVICCPLPSLSDACRCCTSTSHYMGAAAQSGSQTLTRTLTLTLNCR